ncbi:Innexin [Caligus rogercresseyi]|uniref:Innexin n=1 Tax=Caligus rogercresseyi TaxID=217165 RepID=A0A7T8K729_CALRO|nr:Innexin [Caligus rogercresseyi]
MLGVFGPLTAFLKLDSVWIDNNVFRLHYKATPHGDFRQFFGDPIDCMVDGVPGTSWTLLLDPLHLYHPQQDPGEIGTDMPFPGISPSSTTSTTSGSASSYSSKPHSSTRHDTSGRLLKEGRSPCSEKSGSNLAHRQILFPTRGTHTLYALRYFLCEVLNFANSILQIYFIDYFLNYEFTSYGTRVLEYSEMDASERDDPMALVFPKVTKCTFHKYGPSGTIETKDGLCVLPLNIINEKIFIFLWFWLIIIAAISGLFLIYRLFVLCGFQIRVALITYRGGRSTKRDQVASILNASSLSYMEKIGDWLVLYLLCKNLDVLTVNELIKHLSKSSEMSDEKAETMKLNASSTV